MRDDAFREIVSMGESAIPLILEKIAAGQQGLWWILLETITGARPDEGITPIEGTKGWVGMDVPTVHAAWLRWGREHGHLPEEEQNDDSMEE